MSEQWIDVTDQIKLYGDLAEGDLCLSKLAGLLFEVRGWANPEKIRLVDAFGRREDFPRSKLLEEDSDFVVLRRWDKLALKPYTVELLYDGIEDYEPYRTFVSVDGRLSDVEQVKKAIELARIECFAENGWIVGESDRKLTDLNVAGVMRGTVGVEAIPYEEEET